MHKVIKRRTGLAQLDLAELWTYRELLGFLAWRDVAVRYKQTTVGILWAFIRRCDVVSLPLFGRIAVAFGRKSYPVRTFAALRPWQFFATALTDPVSHRRKRASLSKIIFPLIIPLGRGRRRQSTSWFHFSFSFCSCGYRCPSPRILWLTAFACSRHLTLGVVCGYAALYAVTATSARHPSW